MSDGKFRLWLLQSKSPDWIGDNYAVQPEAITADELHRHIFAAAGGPSDLSITSVSDATYSLDAANREAFNLAETHRRLVTPLWPPMPPMDIADWKASRP